MDCHELSAAARENEGLFIVPALVEYTGGMAVPYELLSRVYDEGWGDFSLNYAEMIDSLLRERGIRRARILDLACGTGVLAVALASLGHTVRGIDISAPMLEAAQCKTKGQPRLSFETGDMTRLELAHASYDTVVCSFDSINYLLKVTDLKRLFRTVSAALKTGGLLLFDSNTEVIYRAHHGEVEPHQLGGETVLEESRYDARSRTATTLFSFPDGRTEVHFQRPYNDEELTPRLEAAGLRVLERYSWFNGIPSTENSPKIFYITEKV